MFTLAAELRRGWQISVVLMLQSWCIALFTFFFKQTLLKCHSDVSHIYLFKFNWNCPTVCWEFFCLGHAKPFHVLKKYRLPFFFFPLHTTAMQWCEPGTQETRDFALLCGGTAILYLLIAFPLHLV